MERLPFRDPREIPGGEVEVVHLLQVFLRTRKWASRQRQSSSETHAPETLPTRISCLDYGIRSPLKSRNSQNPRAFSLLPALRLSRDEPQGQASKPHQTKQIPTQIGHIPLAFKFPGNPKLEGELG